jgi:hypothetical protein
MRSLSRMQHVGLYSTLTLLFCMIVFTSGRSSSRAALATHIDKHDGMGGNVSVLTFKYNNQHTGSNPNEVVLNTSNVNTHQFGRLLSYPVDGQVYAQPLYIPNVNTDGQTRNLVIAATEGDSVYAFDADQTGENVSPVWQTNFAGGNFQPVTSAEVRCNDLNPDIGITSTPVVDSSTNTLYVVSFLINNGSFNYYLHALDLSTGRDRSGSPIEIQVPGTTFQSKMERQRAALLFENNRLYLGFASFCDNPPYHGWIISYSYDGHSFQRQAALNVTPSGSEGGIWGGGGALAADTYGYVYAITGNGTFNLNRGGQNAGDTYLKLSPNLRIIDYFAPFNQQCLNASDGDLGSGGPLLLPGNEMTGGTKDGKVYLINTNKMGHFTTINNACNRQNIISFDHIIQEFPLHTLAGGIYSVPAYWNGPDGAYVFFSGVNDYTKAFRLSNGHISGPLSKTPEKIRFSGGNPVISSDSTRAGTGILWLTDRAGYLRAYDATNLTNELYHDAIGSYVKFSVPIVSDGKVFVPTANSLEIYGLLPDTSNAPGNNGQPNNPGNNGQSEAYYDFRRDNRSWRGSFSESALR